MPKGALRARAFRSALAARATTGALKLGAVAALSSCGSYLSEPVPPKSYPAADDTQSVVCVVRLGTAGTEHGVPVWDNDVLVGGNGPACHFCYPVAPGRHALRSENYVTAELNLEVAPNARIVVKQDVDRSAFPSPTGRGVPSGVTVANTGDIHRIEWVELSQLGAQDGELAMNQSRRCELREVPRGERLPRGGLIPAATQP